MDTILGVHLPIWLKMGYQIVVTSDHGMDDFGHHGGTLPEHREVPLFIFSDCIPHQIGSQVVAQLQIAPPICHLLGLEKGDKMQELDWKVLRNEEDLREAGTME